MSLTDQKSNRLPHRSSQRRLGEIVTLVVLGAALLFTLQITFGFIRG